MKATASARARLSAIEKAVDLLESGESAIVIYTDGREFECKQDGSGHTAYWAINPGIQINKVIIYRVMNRHDSTSRENYVYVGMPGRISGPFRITGCKKARYKIELSNITAQGISDNNWFAFAETGPNPIRFVVKSKV